MTFLVILFLIFCLGIILIEVFGGFDKTRCIIMSLCIICFFCLISAIRTDAVPDTIAYKQYFYRISTVDFFVVDGRFSIGFEIFTKILYSAFFGQVQIYFAFIALINCVIMLYVLYNKEKPSCIPFIIYIVLFGFFYNLTVLRAGLAISLILLGVKFSKKHKLWFFAFLLLAISFHSTAIIGILVFPFLFIKENMPINKRVFNVWFVIIFILYFTKIMDNIVFGVADFLIEKRLLPDMLLKYKIYFQNVDVSYDISIMYILNYIIVLLLINNSKQINARILLMYMVGTTMYCSLSSLGIMVRATDYLNWSSIFLIGNYFVEQVSSKQIICSTNYVKNNAQLNFKIINIIILILFVLLNAIFFGRMLMFI